ncbi:hypothetical protein [Flavobacterium sp.]|uniref:hypothetical protein n=1 Tax=Flavobacterium sp. TaxID=239 RepID=UPI0026208CDE|nr:hypothetical protein [Flavobacterium sp.]
MRRKLYILTLIFLSFGCENKKKINNSNNFDTLKIGETDSLSTELFSDNLYKSDSLTINVKNNNFNFFIELTIENQKKEYDLTKLNIPTKTPNEIKWVNNEFACMMTWWSQAQSRHIFIPTKRTNELIYLDKDIEETDSANNNIVYIDSVHQDLNKIVFKVENLLTRKSKSLELTINEQNGVYPFYDKIILSKNKLIITSTNEKRSIDIKEINNGL